MLCMLEIVLVVLNLMIVKIGLSVYGYKSAKANKADVMEEVCYRQHKQGEKVGEILCKQLGGASQLLSLILTGMLQLTRCLLQKQYSREEAV